MISSPGHTANPSSSGTLANVGQPGNGGKPISTIAILPYRCLWAERLSHGEWGATRACTGCVIC
jgi:hypothetical protein